MLNIDELMFRREHFPVEVSGPYKRRGGSQYYDFNTIIFPPCHPSIVQEGIDLELALTVLSEALRASVLDLEEVADRIDDVKPMLQELTPEQRNGEVHFSYQPDSYGVIIPQLPIVSELTIDNQGLHFSWGSAECYIHAPLDRQPYTLRTVTVFPEALMKEYGMKAVGLEEDEPQQIKIEYPHAWHSHNTNHIDDIFGKNFAIAYNNAVVNRKHPR